MADAVSVRYSTEYIFLCRATVSALTSIVYHFNANFTIQLTDVAKKYIICCMEQLTLQRLAERSEQRNTFVYTDFLEEQDQKIAIRMQKFATARGGAPFAVRKIVRFGNPEETGYDEPFPLAILQIKPTGGKFATTVTHRDILGAMMNLGVAREKIGDIFANETSYAVVADTLADYFVDNLTKVGRNTVCVTIVPELPDDLAPKTEEKRISAESDRIDCIVAKLYNLSRSAAQTLVADERVKINGEICVKATRSLHVDDVVSVRGYGKFRFVCADGQSKKGKTYYVLEMFC